MILEDAVTKFGTEYSEVLADVRWDTHSYLWWSASGWDRPAFRGQPVSDGSVADFFSGVYETLGYWNRVRCSG